MVEEYSRVGLSAAGGASPGSALAFITFSNPQQVKASNNRYLVRSHVLKDFHAKKRQQWVLRKAGLSHRQRCGNFVCKIDEVQEQCSCGDTHDGSCGRSHQWHQTLTQSTEQALTLPPVGILGAGRTDPYSTYPRPVLYHERLLVDYCTLYHQPY